MELFQEALNSSPTKTYQREPSTPSFQGLRSALSEDGRGGAPAIRRMRRAASLPPSVLLFAGTVHSPAAPLLASSASPRFGMPPPVQAPEPGSGYCCSAERTRGREKCFRGNGPRVGVCKLASVPAGAAVATGLARRAGAWRRRRAAGKTAGGRAWQVSQTHRELHRENSFGKPNWQTLFLQTVVRNLAESRDSWTIYHHPLAETTFYLKTKAVQYGSRTEGTQRSGYSDLVTVLQTTVS